MSAKNIENGRRGFLRLVGIAAGTAVLGALHVEFASGVELAQESGDTGRIRLIAEKKWTLAQLAYRVTNAWKGVDGFNYLGYQGVILQELPTTEEVRLWNTLDEMYKKGFDASLDNGSLGVTIPPYEQVDDKSGGNLEIAIANRISIFGVPSEVVAFANEYRDSGLEPGVFTSSGKRYPGGYRVWRLQRIAIQMWDDGRTQRILAGDAAKKAGIVPKEAQLQNADLNFGKFDSPAVVTQPAVPENTVKLPPLPSGGLNDEQMAKFTESQPWKYDVVGGATSIRTSENAIGVIRSFGLKEGKVEVTVSTDKANPQEVRTVVIDPLAGVNFVVERTGNVWYRASSAEEVIRAFELSVKIGDRIYLGHKISGQSFPGVISHPQPVDTLVFFRR